MAIGRRRGMLAEMKDLYSGNDDLGVDVSSFVAILINKEAIDNPSVSICSMVRGGTEVFNTLHEAIAELTLLAFTMFIVMIIPLPQPEGGSWDHISPRTQGREFASV
jgi:hypothetical protein